MNKLPGPRSGWFGPPTLAALSIALFVYSVLLLIPYLIALWLVLCPLQLLTGLGLLAFGGTKRQVGVGILIATLIAVVTLVAYGALAPSS
ncbi:hypothetical protein [Nocardia coubleae]|uniref:Uncharacterized protein n=1 Tax=Nocardia coubleae TaxID=356147 RepID=A0A846W000_9NOCA|nr:hypothetical protein [Nocardia coubleae]NKX86421.1 hypothetical protein [Nocardia coubleae]